MEFGEVSGFVIFSFHIKVICARGKEVEIEREKEGDLIWEM